MPRKKGLCPNKGSKMSNKVMDGNRFRLQENLVRFISDPTISRLQFSPTLSKNDRALVHDLARTLGLKSFSTGRDPSRFITVYKRENHTTNAVKTAADKMLVVSSDTIINLQNQFPLAAHEKEVVVPEPSQAPVPVRNSGYNQQPRVPVFSANPNLKSFRENLPIFQNRNEILHAIESNSVVIISGQTGCGKTTQVPQYILEDAEMNNRPVRIVCSMPRRVATTSVSERVARERGEVVGHQIGYQIKLDSRTSKWTVLTYCTNGVLLRHLLTTGMDVSNLTHIIIDEIHERDRLSDFSLIALRQMLTKNPQLRLILMSATLDTGKFNSYFKNYLPYGKECPVIKVPGRMFPVKDLFLEEILVGLQYQTKEMKSESSELSTTSVKTTQNQAGDGVSDEIKGEMDILLKCALSYGEQQTFNNIVKLTVEHESLINHQDCETGMTGLMIAIASKNLEIVEELLELCPSLDIHDNTGKTIFDWGDICEDEEISFTVRAYVQSNAVRRFEEASDSKNSIDHVKLYLNTHGDLDIDANLVFAIIDHIHSSQQQGAILVFLAGYEFIMAVKEIIHEKEKKLDKNGRILIYVLHSKMQINDQSEVFKNTPGGSRKVILATNIAETSITIKDVVYVIDTGKVKQQNYNSTSAVYSLQTEWISRACAQQRSGRAGRTCDGICFHLYSRQQYRQMLPFHVPEILREPLEELCLHTKRLIPPTSPIQEFLSQAIEPPSEKSITNAIQSLKTMEALDDNENLTDLGYKIIELTTEPRLAKMLIYAIILKCLDPVLTIVCCLSEGDPFKMPANPALKKAATQAKLNLSEKTISDHMVLLRVFQEYRTAVENRNEYRFCDTVFVNGNSLEIVRGMRNQLKNQLNLTDSMEVNKYSDRWAVVKAAIMAGLYPNLAQTDLQMKNIRTKKEVKVMVHPSSVVRDNKDKEGKKFLPSQWIVFEELHCVGILSHIRTCTVVSPVTVCLFAGPSQPLPDAAQHGAPFEPPVTDDVFDLTGDDAIDLTGDDAIDLTGDDRKEMIEDEDELEYIPDNSQGSITFLKVDDWVKIPMHSKSAELIYYLRLKWRTLVTRRLRNLDSQWSVEDQEILRAVVEVLTEEDKALGFAQPEGVADEIPSKRRGKKETLSNITRSVHNQNLGGKKENLSNIARSVQNQNLGGKREIQSNCQRYNQKKNQAKVRYFLIKQGDLRWLEESMTEGVWPFTDSTANKLSQCFKNFQRVMLVFSLHSISWYQGYAELKGLFCRHTSALRFANKNQAKFLPVEWKETRPLNSFKKRDSNGQDVHSALMAKRDDTEITEEMWNILRNTWNELPDPEPSCSSWSFRHT